MQHLTLTLVKNAVKECYRKGMLIAQNTDKIATTKPPWAKLNYKVNGYRCAIGAALNDETLAELKARNLRDGVIAEGLVKVNERDFEKIRAIQTAHDEWAQGIAGAERRFKKLVGLS